VATTQARPRRAQLGQHGGLQGFTIYDAHALQILWRKWNAKKAYSESDSMALETHETHPF